MIQVETKNKNKYLYFRNSKLFLLSHPILSFFHQEAEKGVNLSEFLDEVNKKFDIPLYRSVKKEELKYYYSKYLFYEHHYSDNSLINEPKPLVNLKSQEIETFLANTNDISFEMTEKCNLACDYCTYSDNYAWFDKRKNKSISFVKIKGTLDLVLKYSESSKNKTFKKKLSIQFYGGEPLLEFKLIKKTVQYVNKQNLKNTKISFGMTTNGLLLKKYAHFLVKNKFVIMISLDGNEKNNSFRKYHNKMPAFNDIMTNILYIKGEYPEFFKTITFNSVLNSQSSVNEINSFFKTQFNMYSKINGIGLDGVKKEKRQNFLSIYKNINEEIEQFEDYWEIDMQKYINSPNYFEAKIFLYSLNNSFFNYNELIYGENAEKVTDTCMPFTHKVFVTANGKILPCENINHKHYLAKVDDSRLDLDFSQIANKYNNSFRIAKETCKTCYMADHCNQCMFYLNFENDKMQCSGYMSKHTKFSTFLSSRIELFENKPSLYSWIFKNDTII